MFELKVGRIWIRWLEGGVILVDGGTMFGMAPKALWEKKIPADDQNRIPCTAWPLLIQTPEANAIVETGLGNKLTEKMRRNYAVQTDWAVPESLAACGLTVDDIDAVIYTHLHWDHGGGGTTLGPHGMAQPTFPRARHVINRLEWEAACRPHFRATQGYPAQDWQAIEAAGLVELVEGEAEIVPGISVHHTGGHSKGHQAVLIRSEGEGALHLGDVMPTHAHLNPLWLVSYEVNPEASVDAKRFWIAEAERNGWWLTFYHDARYVAARWNEAGELVDTIGPQG